MNINNQFESKNTMNMVKKLHIVLILLCASLSINAQEGWIDIS